MLMGRYTYEAYAGAWLGRGGDYADRINAMPKYVASTALKATAWSNTYVTEGDLGEAVTSLRLKPDHNILMHGYGPVAKTLARQGLLDELHLWVHPMLAGVGGPSDILISEGLNKRLSLLMMSRRSPRAS